MNDMTKPDSATLARRIGGPPHLQLPPLPEISRARYTDEAFYRSEMEYVFRRTWLQVAHVSEFEKEGSYLTVDLPMAPVIIVRGKDGKLRAFLNACRHRGASVVREEKGCVRVMACPYHGWTYDLKGQLIGLPVQESFPGLVLEDHALENVRCELWGGFVFINLDKSAPALTDWIEPMTRRFAAQAEAPLRIVSKQSWEVNCNWKMAVEAFREAYHVPTVHPRTAAAALDGYDTFYELYPNGGGTVFIPYSKAIMAQEFSGVSIRASTLIRLTGTEDEKYSKTTLLASVFPNAMIGFQPMGFPLITSWPVAVDRCRLQVNWYGMDWGDGPIPAEWTKVVDDFTVLTGEDLANLSSMQKSLEADPGKGIPLSALECTVYQLHAEIDKLIGAENIPAHLRVPDILGDFIEP